MGAWGDTQAAYYGDMTLSECSEKCTIPDMMCDLCQYALVEEIGFNNHRTFCLLNDSYIVKPFHRKLGT